MVNNLGIEIPVMGNMIGSSGRLSQNNGDICFIRPSQQRIKLEYINIQNTTENTLKIYSLNDDTNSAFPTYQIGGRMAISLKLTQKLSEGVVITFVNPNPTTIDEIKPLEIIWSDVSKDWNSSLAPSYVNDFVGQNVNIINTPHTIVDGGTVNIGNIPHSIIDSGVVNIGNVPHTVVDSGNISISNIPHVIVDSGVINTNNDYSSTLTSSQNNTLSTLTAPAVANKRNYCTFISYNTKGGAIGFADVAITIKDGTTTIYNDTLTATSITGQKEYIPFNPPLQCNINTNLTLNIDASGTTGTIINANMGYINK